LIIEGVTGRSAPIDNSAFITAAVTLLSDRAALPAMGRHAADHIRQHFTFERQFQNTLALYDELLAARP
jgi:hypothetical protein